MTYQDMYKKKLTTIEHVYEMLEDGEYITIINNSAEPQTFLKRLHEAQGKVKGLCVQMGNITFTPKFFEPEYKELAHVESTFFGRNYSPLQTQGRSAYVPVHLRNSAKDVIYHLKRINRPIRRMVVSVSPMDKHGYFSTATNGLAPRMWQKYADEIIVEVNEACPRTFGDTHLHISEVTAIYNSDEKTIFYAQKPNPSEIDRQIGRAIAEMVNDGDTIQLGIGGIPSACAMELAHKKDLGIHTEMFNDGLMYLCECGAVTNRRKNYFRNKIVTSFSAGTKELFDYVDNNMNILHLAVAYVNLPEVVSRNDNFVSVNTTLQVDLMGQCCSEAIQTRQISGTGGQTETIIGAKESHGGRSIIALHSTRDIKQPDGSRKRISNIQSVHPEGAVVSLSRNDVDFVCTEYGIAALRGATLRERARALINVAHPDYRAQLEEDAKRLWLL
ncbi:MAG: 4-hydroxybutyrate--acetyl-CoA CoA transferase [Clostridia bacterium]|nr:4-hydroxybutyrate--acetyl-CoA CoA transferase [Clostridia bacterium]